MEPVEAGDFLRWAAVCARDPVRIDAFVSAMTEHGFPPQPEKNA